MQQFQQDHQKKGCENWKWQLHLRIEGWFRRHWKKKSREISYLKASICRAVIVLTAAAAPPRLSDRTFRAALVATTADALLLVVIAAGKDGWDGLVWCTIRRTLIAILGKVAAAFTKKRSWAGHDVTKIKEKSQIALFIFEIRILVKISRSNFFQDQLGEKGSNLNTFWVRRKRNTCVNQFMLVFETKKISTQV